MLIVDQRLTTLKQLFESHSVSTESSFSDCIESISSCFIDLDENQRQSVLEMFIEHLESCEVTTPNESQNSAFATIRLKLRLMFALECRKMCTSIAEVAADSKLSDWLSDVLGRLRVCISDRHAWKQFLETELVARYSEIFGYTLLYVYLNMGIEPPDSLPKDPDLNGSCSFNMGTMDELEGSFTKDRSPSPLTSPRSVRLAIRQSLPRAVFTDFSAVVVAATPCSSHTPANISGSCDRVTPSPLPRSLKASLPGATTSSGISRLTQLDTSTSSTPRATAAPQLVLIPCPRSRRRKGRTPTKRTVLAKRKPKGTVQASQLTGSPAANSSIGDKGASHTSSSAVVHRKKSSSTRPSRRQPTSANPVVVKLPASSTAAGQVTPKDRHRSYRRSVHETPNPDKSHPRWERALLAAAEKTRSKAVVVEESPIKPCISLGSPLRRLRRANSMLVSLFHLETAATSTSSQPTSDSTNKSHCRQLLSPRLSAVKQSCSQQPNQQCLSVGMHRAERWLRRQYDEEASLSQFSDSPPTRAEGDSEVVVVVVGQHTPSSGLLSVYPGVGSFDLLRRNSNLFANMASPEAVAAAAAGRKQLSPTLPMHFRKTPVKRTISKHDHQTPTTAYATPPSAARHQRKTTSVKAGNKSASSCNSRRRHLSGSLVPATCNAFSRDIPISPQVFDEEAMFLGREEFLNKTTNSTPSVTGEGSPRHTPSGGYADDGADTEAVYSSHRKRCRLTPYASSPMKPPVFRLATTVGSPTNVNPSQVAVDSTSHTRRRHQREASVCQLSPSFSRFNRPARSPFAPLHVFNCPPVNACEFDTVTANSQSGSALVAMRTHLFGGSNTNSNDTDFENHPPPHRPSSEDAGSHSLHPWEEEDCYIDPRALSSGLKRLSDSHCPPECSDPVTTSCSNLDTVDSEGSFSRTVPKGRLKLSSVGTMNTRKTAEPHRSLFR